MRKVTDNEFGFRLHCIRNPANWVQGIPGEHFPVGILWGIDLLFLLKVFGRPSETAMLFLTKRKFKGYPYPLQGYSCQEL